jgi:hypothetical protein
LKRERERVSWQQVERREKGTQLGDEGKKEM